MIIAILSVKNEEWIIRRNLITLERICDKILIKLDNCNDSTAEICKSFRKVITIAESNNETGNLIKEENRRQVLLEKAREITKNPILISVDADEIFSSEILNPKYFDQIKNLEPGEGFTCSFKELWFSKNYFRGEAKSEWAGRKLPCIWRDDSTNYPSGNRHENRVPNIRLKHLDLPLIHFARVVPNRYWSRIRYYILFDILKNNMTDWKINYFYSVCWREEGMQLKECPKYWFKEWKKIDKDFLHFTDEEQNWFITESISLFSTHDYNLWKEADIFDFNWIDYFIRNNIEINNELKKRIQFLQNNREKKYIYLRKYGYYPPLTYNWFHFKIISLLTGLGIYNLLHKLIFSKK